MWLARQQHGELLTCVVWVQLVWETTDTATEPARYHRDDPIFISSRPTGTSDIAAFILMVDQPWTSERLFKMLTSASYQFGDVQRSLRVNNKMAAGLLRSEWDLLIDCQPVCPVCECGGLGNVIGWDICMCGRNNYVHCPDLTTCHCVSVVRDKTCSHWTQLRPPGGGDVWITSPGGFNAMVSWNQIVQFNWHNQHDTKMCSLIWK